MSGHVAFLRKLLVTLCTPEWFYVVVVNHMSFDVAFLVKDLSAAFKVALVHCVHTSSLVLASEDLCIQVARQV